MFVQKEAKKGCEQVLWLYGPDHELTEAGTMNIFVFWTHEDGALELVTPPWTASSCRESSDRVCWTWRGPGASSG